MGSAARNTMRPAATRPRRRDGVIRRPGPYGADTPGRIAGGCRPSSTIRRPPVATGRHQEPEIAAMSELLAARGAAGISHPGGTLLAHLQRVHALLAQWGARPAVQLAGLDPAFYCPAGFAP